MAIKGADFWGVYEKADLVETVFNNVNLLAYKSSKKSVSSLLEDAAQKAPAKIALVCQEQKLSYSELLEKVIVMASNLKEKYQLLPGERVAVLMGNRLEFVVSIFAISYLGAVACALNARLAPREITYMLKDSGSRILISEDAWVNKLKAYLPETDVQTVINIMDTGGNLIELDGKIVDFFTLFNRKIPRANRYMVDPDLPAMLLYTSGTTGKPKGVILTHFNIINSVISYAKVLHLSKEDNTVIAVPLFYVTGLLAQLFLFIYLGGTTYIMREFHTRDLLQLIEEKEITFFHAATAIYNILLQAKDREQYSMRSLKMALCGGAPISRSSIRKLIEWMPWLDFRTVYGLTESSSPATIFPHKRIFDKQDTAGIPIPVVELKIIDNQGNQLPVGEIGEIALKGAVIVPGYWKKVQETQQTFKDGWLLTGDLGRIDADGFLYILDRKKDMIIRGGENIYSSEVENVLLEHPKIIEAAVVGIPDPVMGEELKACVVLKPGECLTAEDIQDWARAFLAKFKAPRYVEFYDCLPRNANGKILKAALKTN